VPAFPARLNGVCKGFSDTDRLSSTYTEPDWWNQSNSGTLRSFGTPANSNFIHILKCFRTEVQR
jgi:hypothetical protein